MSSAFSRALRYLGYRARTVAEVRDYLVRNNYPSEEIQAALGRLLELGFLDDEKVARSWLEGRLAARPLGKKLAAWEMKKRGLAPEVIQEALGDLLADEDEFQAALHLYEKTKTPPERDKFLRRLYNRGFSRDTINKVNIHIFGK